MIFFPPQIHQLARSSSPKFIPVACSSGTDIYLSPYHLPGPVPGAQASQRSKLLSLYERDLAWVRQRAAQGQLASELECVYRSAVPQGVGLWGWEKP